MAYYELNFYGVMFILSLILLLFLLLVGHKQNITYYMLLFMVITVRSYGCYSISCSKTLETALLGNRLVYFGTVFTPTLLLICIYKLCKMKIPKILIISLMTFGMVVLYYASSIGYTGEYYKNVSIGTFWGMTYLIKEYGPMHILFSIYLILSCICTFFAVVYAFFNRKKASYKVATVMLIAEIATAICYLTKIEIFDGIEITSIAYLVDEIIVLILIRRIKMYEISEHIAHNLDQQSKYGYMVFDNQMKYIGCNNVASRYFPEILNLKIDEKMTRDSVPFLYDSFSECINEEKESHHEQNTYINSIEQSGQEQKHEHVLERDGVYIKCSIGNLYYGKHNKKIGYLIEINDETQQQKYVNLLNNYNMDLLKEVEGKTEKINRLQEKLVLGMAEMIGNRDNNTGGHIKRTSKIIKIFTEKLRHEDGKYELSEEFLNGIIKAAPMHDLGKIAVDDSILRKPGKFTDEEFEQMKKHSEKGAEIVGQLLEGIDDESFVNLAKNVAHYHHEKWNGMGYPKGLSKEEIPLEARIMALADVFDALVSKRCYKEKMDYGKAFTIIEESAGSHFDPDLAKLFLECKDKLIEFYDNEEKNEPEYS